MKTKKIFKKTLVTFLTLSLLSSMFVITASAGNVGLSAPSSCLEADSFSVSTSVPCDITFDGRTIRNTMSAVFTAPFVTRDTNMNIHAVCCEDQTITQDATIRIIDRPLSLSVSNAGQVSELEEFTVTVRDQDGELFSGAKVKFAGALLPKYTGSNGAVSFTAPLVNDDTEYSITASAENYESGSSSITVKNRCLTVSAPDTVNEGGSFTVSVTDEKGSEISANVFFYGQVKRGSSVSFDAPWVDENKDLTYTATKSGYTQDHKSITVINWHTAEPAHIIGSVSCEDDNGNYVPTSGVSVVATGNGNSYSGSTLGNGRYDILIDDLPEDDSVISFSVTASKTDYSSETKSTSLSQGDTKTLNFGLDKEDDDGINPSSASAEICDVDLYIAIVGDTNELTNDLTENQPVLVTPQNSNHPEIDDVDSGSNSQSTNYGAYVSISGPSSGTVGNTYYFRANLCDPDFSYSWSGASGSGSSSHNSWSYPGTKYIHVTIKDGDGNILGSDTHSISISGSGSSSSGSSESSSSSSPSSPQSPAT